MISRPSPSSDVRLLPIPCRLERQDLGDHDSVLGPAQYPRSGLGKPCVPEEPECITERMDSFTERRNGLGTLAPCAGARLFVTLLTLALLVQGCTDPEPLVVPSDASAPGAALASATGPGASSAPLEPVRGSFAIRGTSGIQSCSELILTPPAAARSPAGQAFLTEHTTARWPKGTLAEGRCPSLERGRRVIAECSETATKSLDAGVMTLGILRKYYGARGTTPSATEERRCAAAGGRWRLVSKDDPVVAIEQFRHVARGVLRDIEAAVKPDAAAKGASSPSTASSSAP